MARIIRIFKTRNHRRGRPDKRGQLFLGHIAFGAKSIKIAGDTSVHPFLLQGGDSLRLASIETILDNRSRISCSFLFHIEKFAILRTLSRSFLRLYGNKWLPRNNEVV